MLRTHLYPCLVGHETSANTSCKGGDGPARGSAVPAQPVLPQGLSPQQRAAGPAQYVTQPEGFNLALEIN